VNELPFGFTVVWSIGHINFHKGSINPVYPISFKIMPYLVNHGYSLREMINAKLELESYTALIARRNGIFQKIQNLLAKPIFFSSIKKQNLVRCW